MMYKVLSFFFNALIKKPLQKFFPGKSSPILVASMGRSGSTVLYDAIGEAISRNRLPFLSNKYVAKIFKDQAWDLSKKNLVPGWVYKTHGLAHELPDNSEVIVIFIYGSATDAALSVHSCRERYGLNWIERHFKHLRSNGTFEDLGMKDVLRFSDQINGWTKKTGTRRLIVHYDELWDNVDILSNFLNMRIKLPKKLERKKSNESSEIKKLFSETYKSLDDKISLLPKCQLLE